MFTPSNKSRKQTSSFQIKKKKIDLAFQSVDCQKGILYRLSFKLLKYVKVPFE